MTAPEAGPEIDWKGAADVSQHLYYATDDMTLSAVESGNLARAYLAKSELLRNMAEWLEGAPCGTTQAERYQQELLARFKQMEPKP